MSLSFRSLSALPTHKRKATIVKARAAPYDVDYVVALDIFDHHLYSLIASLI